MKNWGSNGLGSCSGLRALKREAIGLCVEITALLPMAGGMWWGQWPRKAMQKEETSLQPVFKGASGSGGGGGWLLIKFQQD